MSFSAILRGRKRSAPESAATSNASTLGRSVSIPDESFEGFSDDDWIAGVGRGDGLGPGALTDAGEPTDTDVITDPVDVALRTGSALFDWP